MKALLRTFRHIPPFAIPHHSKITAAGIILMMFSPWCIHAETITFDGPDYVGGQRPPLPWTDRYTAKGAPKADFVMRVESGTGVGGSQSLVVQQNEYFEGAAVYLLPKPLTPDDGAQRIAVKLDPSGPMKDGQINFMTFGGFHIGNGWMQEDTGSHRGILFRAEDWSSWPENYKIHPEDFKIFGPGGQMGLFTPAPGPNYYELIFEISADWTEINCSVVAPDGGIVTIKTDWDKSRIDKVWLWDGDDIYTGESVRYDDLQIGVGGNPTPPPEFTSASALDVVAGQPLHHAVTTEPPAGSFAADGLPADLRMDPHTGLITGVPKESGVHVVQVRASAGGGTATMELVITVTSPSPAGLEYGPPMQTARMGHFTVPLEDGGIALIGGHGSGFVALNSMEIWSPAENKFTLVKLPHFFDFGAIARLEDGRYLLAGSAANLGVAPGYNTAMLFDPASRTVSALQTTMNRRRMNCNAARLSNGKVLIVGGWYDQDSARRGEVFDPATGSFVATGALVTPRALPVVLPTPDGNAIIAGGTGVFGTPTIERVEIYDSNANEFREHAPSLIDGETGWVLVGTFGRPIDQQKTADGRYAVPIYRSTGGTTVHGLALFDPSQKSFDLLQPKPAFTPDDAVLGVVVDPSGKAACVMTGQQFDGGVNTRFSVHRVDLMTGVRSVMVENLVVPDYFLGSTGISFIGASRLFVTGGTSRLGFNYNFNPVPKTIFITLPEPPPYAETPELRVVSSGPGVITIRWAATSTPHTLETTRSLRDATWRPHAGPVTLDGSDQTVLIKPQDTEAFFRLRRQ